MMSDDDDFVDYTSTNQSSKNLASLFHGEPVPTAAVATTAYVPPKQPKKDSAPKVMIASVAQVFSFGADQKWVPKGKLGVALLSTDNTIFQIIIYATKTQHVTSVRINTTTTFTPQSNNYLSFQDDGGQNWSVMFDNTQAIVDFALQIIVAKAFLFGFKFDYIVQDIREGEGSNLADHDTVEVIVNTYKFLENGTIQSTDSGENKPVRFKIGKNQNGKAFDEVLRGMKKGGQRVTMIGTAFYSIEVTRIKREKEARSGSITIPAEEQAPVESRRAHREDQESEQKNKMRDRLNKMGGVSMLPNQSSAFAAPLPPHYSDDDSINNEFIQNMVPQRSISTPGPPVQFVQPVYHHHHPLHSQPLMQQPNMYPPVQQPSHDYNNRSHSSMGGMGYQQPGMWPNSQYPPPTSNVPPTDMFYQQQQPQQPFQPDVRQLLNRLNEKVDVLNEKFDTKNSTTYPNMETSILLSNIQRIVKENETVKKDLFDRSAKVEELNSKISDLLDRNQKLIEQSHQTAEQRNGLLNDVSGQTAQKFLDLEKQKVELTNNLSVSTSKIAELQLQINQFTQDSHENQSRINELVHKCQQYKEDLQNSENQRAEIQAKLETTQEQLKNSKTNKKQLQTNLTTLEEELAEVKTTCANLEKGNNERKTKYENERKRWQEDMDEQKHSYEKELDELRAKLRKQRTNDNLSSNQEISRIEQDLEKEWQEKFERQQTQHERLLTSKGKEFEQLKALFNDNETKLQEITAELDESKQQIEVYEERCEKFQERLLLMKEKLIEMNNEQPELINERVKRAINIIFQRLKAHIQPNKQYTGEEFLSRSLEIIKKATLKILSNDDEDEDEDDESSEDDIQSEDENQEIERNDQPLNGNSVDQKTLNEEISSIQTEEKNSLESETLSINNPKYGWDTVDELQHESKIESSEQSQSVLVTENLTSADSSEQNQTVIVTENLTSTDSSEQNQTVLVSEDSTSTDIQVETTPSNSLNENNQSIPSSQTIEEQYDGDKADDTIEQNDEKPSPSEVKTPKEKTSSDDDDDDALFKSPRTSMQTFTPPQLAAPSKYKFNQNIPLLPSADDSDDEIFK